MVQARLRRGARQQTVHGIRGEVVGEVARCQEAGSQICKVDRANFPRRPGEEAHEHSAQGEMGEVIESKLPRLRRSESGIGCWVGVMEKVAWIHLTRNTQTYGRNISK